MDNTRNRPDSPPTDDDATSQHAEMSRIVRTMLFTVVVYCLFCGLTLGQSNKTLFAADAAIDLPFADVQVSYASFLLVGPLVLIAMSVYMHIFIGSMAALGTIEKQKKLPFIFNLTGFLPEAITNFLFYLLPPALLTVFSIKAQPHPYFPFLAVLTVLFAFSMVLFKHKETPANRKPIHWLLPFVLGGFLWINYDFVESDLFDRLNLANADLRKARLDRFDLRNVDLKNARLDSASLRDTRLGNAVLEDVYLRRASLIASRLNGAQFYGADLSRADLSFATLGNARLSKSNLDSASLEKTDLTSAGLRDASLQGADLSRSLLVDADLNGADLRGANLQNANLQRARLRGADLRRAQLAGADLRGAQLSQVRLEGAFLSGALLDSADLSQAQLDSAVLVDATLTGADLTHADLVGADLRRARLPGTDLRHARLDSAELDGANLDGAQLAHASMLGTGIDDAVFARTVLADLEFFDPPTQEVLDLNIAQALAQFQEPDLGPPEIPLVVRGEEVYDPLEHQQALASPGFLAPRIQITVNPNDEAATSDVGKLIARAMIAADYGKDKLLPLAPWTGVTVSKRASKSDIEVYATDDNNEAVEVIQNLLLQLLPSANVGPHRLAGDTDQPIEIRILRRPRTLVEYSTPDGETSRLGEKFRKLEFATRALPRGPIDPPANAIWHGRLVTQEDRFNVVMVARSEGLEIKDVMLLDAPDTSPLTIAIGFSSHLIEAPPFPPNSLLKQKKAR